MLLLSSCAAGTPPPQVEQGVVSDSILMNTYPFIDVAADTIFDPSHNMDRFYHRLRQVDTLMRAVADTIPDGEVGEPRRVNVLHFGDSHIQGGVIGRVLMTHLHRRFGNAGRGMIVPHRISGSNEYRDYSIRTAGSWNASRLVNIKPSLPLGISGVAIQPPTATNRIEIRTLPLPEDSTIDYSFNKIRIFHDQYAPIIEAPAELGADLSAPDIIYDFTTEIDLVQQVDSITLTTSADGKFARGPIYGFCLENGHDGVLFNTMGVNSACYLHWGRQPDVVRQSSAMNPDLIIISLGSNEAAGGNFNDDVFMNEVDRFVAPLRAANPEASVLLTAPAEAFRKGRPNANYGRVSATLRRYAQQKGVAFIDVYAATSGEGSATEWANHDLMARDKIHFTAEGYRIQGLLIYNALYNSYLGYDPAVK